MKKTFETALKSLCPMAMENFALHSMARQIDETRHAVIEAASYVSREMANLANKYEVGRCDTSNPLGSSAVTDLPALIAKHSTLSWCFWDTASMVLPEETFHALRAAVAAGN